MTPHPNPAQVRDQTHQAEQISARHDSPNGGLAAIIARNQTASTTNRTRDEPQEVTT